MIGWEEMRESQEYLPVIPTFWLTCYDGQGTNWVSQSSY